MSTSLVALVGAEIEENLSLRYLAGQLRRAGFTAVVVDSGRDADRQQVIDSVLELNPLAVGISVPFQHHAASLLAIAELLRRHGYTGHICIGGHFATFEFADILQEYRSVDSVVRHEGEETFCELCELLRDGKEITPIAGLVIRRDDQVVVGERRQLPALDKLPFPQRREPPHNLLGINVIPVVGSRGCYADCSFCCIFAYHRTAQGPRYRKRSVENIVMEMEQEFVRRGIRLFVFHDDNFLVPSLHANLQRYGQMTELLQAKGMQDIGIVIKCRPNDVHPELFQLFKRMGVIRAYVGIETNSPEGIISLNRRITPADNRRALAILNELDIFHTFNVLIFDPEATLAGIEQNLNFMEEFAAQPFNFCRAEVYAGTPLKEILAAQGRLYGSYLAWGYEMRQPEVELMFRIASTVFASRNFRPDGIANLNMGVRFDNEVMRRFYGAAWDVRWQARMVGLSSAIGMDSVRHMRSILAFVCDAALDDHRRIKDYTLELAHDVARADLEFMREIKWLRREMEHRIEDRYGGVAIPASVVSEVAI